MLRRPGAKTGLVPKVRGFRLLLVGGLIGLLLVGGVMYANRDRTACALHLPVQQAVGGNTCIKLERAVTSQQRERGLSGRPGMANDQGMLFVFDAPAQHCFWMKDMQFDLDIVWLDADKRVVMVKEHVSPGSYPETFCPEVPAQYVIELNAGLARAVGLAQGKYVSID